MNKRSVLAIGLALVMSAVTLQAFAQQKSPPKAGGDFSGVWLLLGGGEIGSLTFERSPITGGSAFKGFPDSQWSDQKLPFSAQGLELLKGLKPSKGPRSSQHDNDPIHGGNPPGLYRDLILGRPMQFVQAPGMVVQLFSFGKVFRIIYTDGRPVPDDIPECPCWYGYSVGHWEGDTLVVTTTSLDGRAYMDEWGTPISDTGRVEERWRRVAPGQLQVQLTVTDPTIYSKPWTGARITYFLEPKMEIREMLFAPVDEGFFNENLLNPFDKPTTK
jgi:hypothetical protein